MNIEQIKAILQERWQEPVTQLCYKIIDFLASKPRDQLQLLTFRTLTSAAGRENFDPELLSALSILSSSEIPALKMHTAFIDDDDELHEIELRELHEARLKGSLVHPQTGLLLDDFEDKIVPYFSISDSFGRS